MKKGNSSNLRKGRFSESGRIYLVTFVTHQRRPLFDDLFLSREVVKSLNYHRDECETLAFVVMPDHVHWLLQLKGSELSRVVHSVKSYTANQINLCQKVNGIVWQNGFHDHALRKDEDLVNLARYVVMNPVRAGLVRSVREYPHWDAVWL